MRLGEHLLSRAKQLAAKTGQTLMAEDALHVKLAASRKRSAPVKVTLPTYGVGGVLPGVDLDDNASLFEVMDHRDDSA
jgi:hypothetical protein